MPPKVSDEHVEARRQQILMAALSCFAKNGFHGTTMKDICQQADLSPGAVYSYFASKDELIEAIAAWGKQMNDDTFEDGSAIETTDPKEGMRQTIALFIRRMKNPEMQVGSRADIMLASEMLTNPKLFEIARDGYEHVMQQILKAVVPMQEAGIINPDLDSRAVSQVLMTLVSAAGQLPHQDPHTDIDAYLDAVENILFGGFWSNEHKKK